MPIFQYLNTFMNCLKIGLFAKTIPVKIKYFLPAILWAIIILLASLLPVSKIPDFSLLKHADKVIHFGMYFVFAFLISAGIFFHRFYSWRKNYLFSSVVPLFFALLTEILQHSLINSRSGNFSDFFANIAGIAAGIITAKLFSKTSCLQRFF